MITRIPESCCWAARAKPTHRGLLQIRGSTTTLDLSALAQAEGTDTVTAHMAQVTSGFPEGLSEWVDHNDEANLRELYGRLNPNPPTGL